LRKKLIEKKNLSKLELTSDPSHETRITP